LRTRWVRTGDRPGLQHFLVGQWLAGVARAGIGHERHPAHLEADPARGDALEDRRHPDGVRAEAGQPSDLGRGLVRRPGQADVDALLEIDALGLPRAVEGGPQPRAPRVGHVVEARTELVGVAPEEGRPAGQVDVIGHDHQRARAERGIQPAGRVGQDDDPRAEGVEEQDRLDDEPRVVALVQMEPALEHDHGPPAERAEEQPADVPGCGRRRPAGQIAERDGHRIVEVVGQAAQAGAQDDADLGDEIGVLADRADEGAQARRLVDRRDGTGRVERATDVRGKRQVGHAGLQDAQGVTAEARRLRAPDESIDTGMPIASRRAPPRSGRGETAAKTRGQRSARSDRRRNEGP
jgi:hypothetical protein